MRYRYRQPCEQRPAQARIPNAPMGNRFGGAWRRDAGRLLATATLIAAWGSWGGAAGADPAETTFAIGAAAGAAGVRLHVPVTSFKAMRDHRVVKQALDYSCGAAALATLLTYGFGDPTSELNVLTAALEALSQDENALRRKEGLSLLDLKHVAEQRGHRAQGFRIRPDQISRLRGPVIVFIRPRGYPHFAVLRGVRDDRVFLADPSRGNLRQPFHAFRRDWVDADGTGVIFVVQPGPTGDMARDSLFVEGAIGPRPEVLSARQMLEVGNPYARFPGLVP